MKFFPFLILLLCGFSVHDGDTFTTDNGQKIRLFGIDAPEMTNNHAHCPEQLCVRKNGIKYRCAVEARDYLHKLIDGKHIQCEVKGRSYNRVVGDCYADSRSLSESMISSGWAINLRKFSKNRFNRAEQVAKTSRVGMWQGEFDNPSQYRLNCKKGGNNQLFQ